MFRKLSLFMILGILVLVVSISADSQSPLVLYDRSSYWDDGAGDYKLDSATLTTLRWGYNEDTGDVGRCGIDFNVSAIPDGSTINDVDLHIYVHSVVPLLRQDNYMYVMPLDDEVVDYAGVSAQTLYDAIANDGSAYFSWTGGTWTIGAKTWDLGTQADTDLGNALAGDWFSIGVKTSEAGSSGNPATAMNTFRSNDYGANEPYLVVTYTPLPSDTCTCPDINNNWEINHSDACIIENECDLGTGRLNFTGTGTTICNATIYTTGMGDPLNGGTFQVNKNCWVVVS